MPDLPLIVDPRYDDIALTEAIEKKSRSLPLMGSDCDAGKIKYPVIANDSLQTSVKILA